MSRGPTAVARLRRLHAGVVLAALDLIGLAIAGYLSAVELSGDLPFCGPLKGCEEVALSEYSRIGGVPVAIFGVMLSIALFFLAVAWTRTNLPSLLAAHYGLSLLGVVFELYFTYVEIFVIGAVCVWCASYGISLRRAFRGGALGLAAARPIRAVRRRLADPRPGPTGIYHGAMRLTPWEEERLLIFTAAELARRHRAAGLALNAPEAIAIICDAMLEAARAGATYDEVEAAGRAAVAPADVIDGVRELVDEVRLEVLMGDGTRLDRPRRSARAAARPIAQRRTGRGPAHRASRPTRPPTASTATLIVRNESTARRPRLVALPVRSGEPRGCRSIGRRPTGSVSTSRPARSERWAPGETRTVDLVRVRRRRRAVVSRRALAAEERLARYGPTTGDRVRLGDTDLWVRVGEDRQAPGDEPHWGYAKNLRQRMTQAGRAAPSELDVVVVGAVVVDPTIGVVKADIGIKDGRIVGVGRAGNPAISDGIELDDRAAHRRRSSAYGLIATPGAVDSHVHAISPELMPAALSGGVTTLVTAGFEEPPWAMERTLAAMAGWPLNVGLQACARSEDDGRPRRARSRPAPSGSRSTRTTARTPS